MSTLGEELAVATEMARWASPFQARGDDGEEVSVGVAFQCSYYSVSTASDLGRVRRRQILEVFAGCCPRVREESEAAGWEVLGGWK